MKKFFGLIIALLFVTNSALAMIFSQPVEIGDIFVTPSSGILFKNTSYNSGKAIGKFNDEITYRQGVARWGNEEDGIFFHYGDYPPYFGGKNKNNSFPLKMLSFCRIYQIFTDRNIILYMLNIFGSDSTLNDYVVVARKNDGKWVKYFDTNNITEKYFGTSTNLRSRPAYSEFKISGDTIIIPYGKYNLQGYQQSGEFRFKWDESAQWFSVEKIKY